MPHTYILECADGSFYVGSTINLGNRLYMHNLGIASAYTRPARRRPVVLAWSAEFETIGAAFYFEKQVQNWGRAKRIALIEGRLDDLPALARGRNRPPLKSEDESPSPDSPGLDDAR
jgi:putative endonuclease